MTTPNAPDKSSIPSDRRTWTPMGRAVLAGVRVRDEDIEPTRGLHAVAIFLRVMAVAVFLLMAVEVTAGVTGAGDTSYRAVFAEAIRLAISSGLLWAAGALADLFIKSHGDLRATRILMARLAYRLGPSPSSGEASPGPSAPDRRREGSGHER